MTKAVYPGTFDPITFGHVDILERAANLFDEVVVAVTTNPTKKPFFSLAERVSMVKASISHLDVGVASFDGLLVDFAKRENAGVVVRGLRALSDFEEEIQLAAFNKRLAPRLETVCIMAGESFNYLSSGMVREIALLGGNVSAFVPKPVESALQAKVRGLMNTKP